LASTTICLQITKFNEKSKALRYKRLLEAKAVGTKMITSCPKCRMHLNCLKKDYDEFASMEIIDFSDFLCDITDIINSDKKIEVKG